MWYNNRALVTQNALQESVKFTKSNVHYGVERGAIMALNYKKLVVKQYDAGDLVLENVSGGLTFDYRKRNGKSGHRLVAKNNGRRVDQQINGVIKEDQTKNGTRTIKMRKP